MVSNGPLLRKVPGLHETQTPRDSYLRLPEVKRTLPQFLSSLPFQLFLAAGAA